MPFGEGTEHHHIGGELFLAEHTKVAYSGLVNKEFSLPCSE